MTALHTDYQLIDFGEGRKLERFGPWVLDRPCPTAERLPKSQPAAWREATARFDGSRMGEGTWSPAVEKWDEPVVRFSHAVPSELTMELVPTPAGQVGVFPDQLGNWAWIYRQLNSAPSPSLSPASGGGGPAAGSQAPRVLNLFAYTGGSTLAAALAGAEVTHVDAARSSVERARRNAELSGLAEHPIRWIVEDAVKFCRRELNRNRQYDAVILDPPSYGHGPKGEPWQIARDLLPLLELCGRLTAERRLFVLATCHTPGIGPAELSAMLADGIFGHCGQPPRTGPLDLQTPTGRRLPSGIYARWPR